MTQLFRFVFARIKFAVVAEFEFINRMSRPLPGTMGMGLIPAVLVGWAVLWLCGFPCRDHLALGGMLAVVVGPLAIAAFFLVVGFALALVPRELVQPVCAEQSVLDLPFVETC